MKPPKPQNFDIPKSPLLELRQNPSFQVPTRSSGRCDELLFLPRQKPTHETSWILEGSLALLFSLLLSLTIKTGKWALFALIPLLSQLKLKLDMWPTSCHVSTLVWVRFRPEAIYSVSVQVQIISLNLTQVIPRLSRFS